MARVQQWYGVAITARGTYFGPGRNPPQGERKLFLLLEGRPEKVLQARAELKNILEEAAMEVAPKTAVQGKYRVVN